MASSALQARDPRVRRGRYVEHERWEMRELSAGGEVSVESSGRAREQRRSSRSTIREYGIH